MKVKSIICLSLIIGVCYCPVTKIRYESMGTTDLPECSTRRLLQSSTTRNPHSMPPKDFLTRSQEQRRRILLPASAAAVSTAINAPGVLIVAGTNNVVYHVSPGLGTDPTCFDKVTVGTDEFYPNQDVIAWIQNRLLEGIAGRSMFAKLVSNPSNSHASLVSTCGSADRAAIDSAVNSLGLTGGLLILLNTKNSPVHSVRKCHYAKNFGPLQIPCYGTCSACSTTQSNGCTSCQGWATLQGNSLDSSLSGRCLCHLGKINAGVNSCITAAGTCAQGCDSCEGSGASQCYKCSSGWQAGARAGDGTMTCTPICTAPCATCTTPASTDCLSCTDLQTYTQVPNSGVPGTVGECKFNCDQTCFTHQCDGTAANQCTQCANSQLKHLPTSGVAGTAGLCVRCHASCAPSQCDGTAANQCIQCANSQLTHLPTSGVAGTAGLCVRCHANCASNQCVGPATNQCTQCINLTDYHKVFTPGVTDHFECRRTCDTSCEDCIADTAQGCTRCRAGYRHLVLNPSTREGTCTLKTNNCHVTCATCNGPSAQDCTSCRNISNRGSLTLKNGECRCQKNTYMVQDEQRCYPCHSDCRSCKGPAADQCVICSNPSAILIPNDGSNTGTCVTCADPSMSSTAQCSTRVAQMELKAGLSRSVGKGTSFDPTSLSDFKPARAPNRPQANNGQHKAPLTFTRNIFERIKLLGESFKVDDLFEMTINGLTANDYTYTGQTNDQDTTYDLDFKFNQDFGDRTITLKVKQPNYFLLNLPDVTNTNTGNTRRTRRNLQSFDSTNQGLLDTSYLLENKDLSLSITTSNYSSWKMDLSQVLGIGLRIAFFTSLVAMALVTFIHTHWFDGRLIGRFLDYAFFVQLATKLALIPATYTTYELLFMDELVKGDTLLMLDLRKESQVRSRLSDKFLEYSIPVYLFNNALVYTLIFLTAATVTLMVGTCLKEGTTAASINKAMRWVLVSLALPSTFFYSSLSVFKHSFSEKRMNGWLKAVFYIISLVAFSITFVLIFSLVLSWVSQKIEEKFDNFMRKRRGSKKKDLKNKNAKNNLKERVTLDGINLQNKNPRELPKFGVNSINIFRYCVVFLLIILLQSSPKVCVGLIFLTQAIVFGYSLYITFYLKEEYYSSKWTGTFVFTSELLLLLLTILLVSTLFDRGNTYNEIYYLTTVPMIALVVLITGVKIAGFVYAIYEERRRMRLEKAQRVKVPVKSPAETDKNDEEANQVDLADQGLVQCKKKDIEREGVADSQSEN